MFERSNHSIVVILESLSLKEEAIGSYYMTRNREEYETLLDAALNGMVKGQIAVGRSGIYLDNRRINPPSEGLSH